MLMDLIKNEFYKQKRNLVILFVLAVPVGIAMLLALDFLIRYQSWLLPQGIEKGLTSWQILINEQRILYFNDFMPVFAALILGTLFECEYKGSSWTFLLTQPVKRSKILLSKYLVAAVYYMTMLLINIASLIIVGKIYKFKEAVPMKFFIVMMMVQLIAGLVIMVIHLFINIKNKNMLVSIGVAAVLSMISSNLYYNQLAINKFNPYAFSLFSINQNKKEIMIIVVMAIVIFSLGSVTIKKYFNSKKIY